MLRQLTSKPAGILLCVLLLLFSCTSGYAGLPKGISNEFFRKPEGQRNAEFAKYDFNAQYDIYIYGCQQMEPPVMGLGWQLARQGAKIVPQLESKLASAPDDLTIRDIVLVFRAMQDLRTYDVAEDKALMDELLEKTSAMKNPSWRIITEDNLQAIRQKSLKN